MTAYTEYAGHSFFYDGRQEARAYFDRVWSWRWRREWDLIKCGRIDADGNILPRDFALEVE